MLPRTSLLALVCATAACGPIDPDVSIRFGGGGPGDRGPKDPTTAPTDEEPTKGGPRFAREADGTVLAVHAPGAGEALFVADAGDFTASLGAFVAEHASSLGLPGKDTSQRAYSHSRRIGRLTVHRFTQTYRDFPLVGAAQVVTVVADRDRARSVVGQLVDDTEAWKGLDSPLDARTAQRTVQEAMRAEYPELAYSLEEVDVVAVPWTKSLAFRGTVSSRGDRWQVFVGVTDGRMDDSTGEPPLEPLEPIAEGLAPFSTVRASSLDATSVFPEAWGNHQMWCFTCVQYPMSYVPFPGGDNRMGNHRVRVFDWRNDADTMPYVVARPLAAAMFDAYPGHQDWDSQEQMHKVIAATNVLDPYHDDGWDYDPSCTDDLCNSNIVPPLNVHISSPFIANAGSFSRGWFPYLVPEEGSMTQQEWEDDVAGPWIDALDIRHPFQTQGQLHNHNNEIETLFHELGHYYDGHNASGPLQPSHAAPCAPGEMEARAMGETLADMLATALVADLYPNIDYLNPLEGQNKQCKSVQGQVAVHHDACDPDPKQFTDDRPAAKGCAETHGYDTVSIQQATWEFAMGHECTDEGCLQPVQNPASLVPALLVAWSAGNHQSPESLFTHMRDALHAQSPAEAARFERIFEHHGVSF